ncbi:carboxymuconolactone decarboxylase family protein [Pseudaminobacter sp. NGMCC 1.201702]|uniref:carboxymuconolactone decarboxylase family protein n=1 Tax=Pseudaminobacter sp. NGMCC 1.201702 TaxID=3391825 RepID=UPI0039EE9022
MPFIATSTDEPVGEKTAEMFTRAVRSFGYLPNMVKVFGDRPEVMSAWNALLESIKSNMDLRRYELVTVAAAKQLRSSYCMLAHGSILLRDHFTAEEVQAIVEDANASSLDAIDRAVMQFAGKVVQDATSISSGDIEGLRSHGLSDQEIFDVAAAAAARCFFSKMLDALGAQPDSTYNEIEPGLRKSLLVGRQIESEAGGSR